MKLWLVKSGAGKIWLVVGGGSEIMPGREWWRQNYGWSWVVMDGGGWSHDLVMPFLNAELKILYKQFCLFHKHIF